MQQPNNIQSFNRYSYVMNNPLNKTDPSGYIWATLISYALNYIATTYATTAIGRAIGYALTAYQYYGYFQLAKGVVNAIEGGGTAMANFAGGFAKSYVKGMVKGAVIQGIAAISTVTKQGTNSTELKSDHKDKYSSEKLSASEYIKREQLTDKEIASVKARITVEKAMITEFQKALSDPKSEGYAKLKENYGFRNDDFSAAAGNLSEKADLIMSRLIEIEKNPQKYIVALEISTASGLGGIQFPNGTIGLSTKALQDSSWVSGLLTHEIHHETGGAHNRNE